MNPLKRNKHDFNVVIKHPNGTKEYDVANKYLVRGDYAGILLKNKDWLLSVPPSNVVWNTEKGKNVEVYTSDEVKHSFVTYENPEKIIQAYNDIDWSEINEIKDKKELKKKLINEIKKINEKATGLENFKIKELKQHLKNLSPYSQGVWYQRVNTLSGDLYAVPDSSRQVNLLLENKKHMLDKDTPQRKDDVVLFMAVIGSLAILASAWYIHKSLGQLAGVQEVANTLKEIVPLLKETIKQAPY